MCVFFYFWIIYWYFISYISFTKSFIVYFNTTLAICHRRQSQHPPNNEPITEPKTHRKLTLSAYTSLPHSQIFNKKTWLSSGLVKRNGRIWGLIIQTYVAIAPASAYFHLPVHCRYRAVYGVGHIVNWWW